MTFSIVARSAEGDALGVAVASKFLAVGSAVPAAAMGIGAIATQAHANTLYRRDGLEFLRDGHDAVSTLAALLAPDEMREHRQCGLVDADGGSASFTGSECMAWAGGLSGPDYAIQGNILTGPQVVADMQAAWLDSAGLALPERLLAVLTAGDLAGGDRRGRQSAALLVVNRDGGYTPGDDLAYDLRVDDHADPVTELARLLALHHVYFDRPREQDLISLDGSIGDRVREDLAALGYSDLDTWAGVENYELRVVGGRTDQVVLDALHSAAARSRG